MVNIPKFFKDEESDSAKLLLPLLPLRDIVVFPHMVAPLFVGREKSVNALSDAMNKDKNVFLVTQMKAGIDNPGEQDISHVGTIGKVLQLLRLPDGTVKALVEGKTRAKISRFIDNKDFFSGRTRKNSYPRAASCGRRSIEPVHPGRFRGICQVEQEYIQGADIERSLHHRSIPGGRHRGRTFCI
jgi:ATP-dependent Lon protease